MPDARSRPRTVLGFAPLRRAVSILRDVGVGVLSLDAYEAYVEHRRRHHADEPLLSRAEFFRRDQAERWEGVRRCC